MKTALVLFVAFAATVYASNWALETYGVVELPGPGSIMVPAGVFFAGLAFGLRDALHEAGGKWWVFVAIAVGGVLSYVDSDGATIPGGHASIAVASASAFTAAELVDFAIYAPLRRRQWTAAVIASNIIGAVADSLLFLWLAFGSVGGWGDLTYGKALMIAPSLGLVWAVRRHTRPAEPMVDFTVMVPGDS